MFILVSFVCSDRVPLFEKNFHSRFIVLKMVCSNFIISKMLNLKLIKKWNHLLKLKLLLTVSKDWR